MYLPGFLEELAVLGLIDMGIKLRGFEMSANSAMADIVYITGTLQHLLVFRSTDQAKQPHCKNG